MEQPESPFKVERCHGFRSQYSGEWLAAPRYVAIANLGGVIIPERINWT